MRPRLTGASPRCPCREQAIPSHGCHTPPLSVWEHMIEQVQASPAPHLDVGAREVIFSHDQVVQGHVIGQRHPARVDLEDALLGLLIGQRELDLPVNAACGNTRFSVTALVPRAWLREALPPHMSHLSQCPVPNLKKKSVSGLKMSGYTEYITIPLTIISRRHSFGKLLQASRQYLPLYISH